MTGDAPFEWRQAKDTIDRFIVSVGDPDVNWAWEVARRCVTVYATMMPGMPSLAVAKGFAWEKFTLACLDAEDSYAGLYGLADEIWSRLPESRLAAFDAAIVKGRAKARGEKPPRGETPTRQAPPTEERRHERGRLRLVVDNTTDNEGDPT